MIIYAVNIHTGGGKILLDEIIQNKTFGNVTAAFLDERYQLPDAVDFPIFTAKSKILGRIQSEFKLHRFLKYNPTNKDDILFFGNIPPFFKPKARSYLYLQNCFLTRQVPLPKDSFKEKLRNWIESILLKVFSRNTDEIWVQTPWMQKLTQKYLPKALVQLKPFLPQMPALERGPMLYDFVFVGSLALNKRLSFFLATLSQLDLKLRREIKVFIALDQALQNVAIPEFKSIQVECRTNVSRDELFKIYATSKAFVTTSLYESFCLPLHEAHNYHCEIIAPRAGYTEDLGFKVRLFQRESVIDLAQILLTSPLKSDSI